jgi:hypothetical protein
MEDPTKRKQRTPHSTTPKHQRVPKQTNIFVHKEHSKSMFNPPSVRILGLHQLSPRLGQPPRKRHF